MSKVYRREIQEAWAGLIRSYPLAYEAGPQASECGCCAPDGHPDPTGWDRLYGPFSYYEMWGSELEGDPDDVVGELLDEEWRSQRDAQLLGYDDSIRGINANPYVDEPRREAYEEGQREAESQPQQMELF